mmetsp:Transcript_36045/g.107732  ORF Transcript_36045/g.107732 Transcript_36045/m.107732 type:complete len:303 (+) Transcript_36045:135-1043(+)
MRRRCVTTAATTHIGTLTMTSKVESIPTTTSMEVSGSQSTRGPHSSSRSQKNWAKHIVTASPHQNVFKPKHSVTPKAEREPTTRPTSIGTTTAFHPVRPPHSARMACTQVVAIRVAHTQPSSRRWACVASVVPLKAQQAPRRSVKATKATMFQGCRRLTQCSRTSTASVMVPKPMSAGMGSMSLLRWCMAGTKYTTTAMQKTVRAWIESSPKVFIRKCALTYPGSFPSSLGHRHRENTLTSVRTLPPASVLPLLALASRRCAWGAACWGLSASGSGCPATEGAAICGPSASGSGCARTCGSG